MLLQTRDEETAKYFKQASSQVPVQKRTQQLWRNDFLGFERFRKTTGATEREQLEYRALDHHIKNLGKGKSVIAQNGWRDVHPLHRLAQNADQRSMGAPGLRWPHLKLPLISLHLRVIDQSGWRCVVHPRHPNAVQID
jgi:hypothetical protein